MYLDKPMPIRSRHRRGRRRGAGPSKGSAVFVVLALGVANYLLFFHERDGEIAPPTIEERLHQTVRPAAPYSGPEPAPAVTPGSMPGAVPGLHAPQAPDLKAGPEERDDFGEPVGRKVAGKLKRGQTVLACLQREGIDSRTALPIIRSMGAVFDFRNAQVGDTFEASLDDEGQVRHFTYVQSPLDVYQVKRQEDGAYAAKKKAVPTRVEVARIGCAIKSNLYESIARCGEGNQLASKLIDLFAWDVDFFQDLRKGDELRVIAEKISVDGRFLKYGKVRAVEYTGKFGPKRIVHYADPDGAQGYFMADGRSIKKEFLKSPLKYTRVSSMGASGIRGSLRKNGPVVYTSKKGTPVQAVSAGTVVFVGKSGKLGNTVTIRHANGYTSTLGHLGKVHRRMKVGRLVNQKTVVGWVGQSGQATEPQLYFSLRKKGKAVNPLRMRVTEADPVSEDHRTHFDEKVKALIEDLESVPVIGIYEKRT